MTGVGAEFTLGVLATVVLAVIGGLLSRSVSQIDKQIENISEAVSDLQLRVALLEKESSA